MTPCLGVARAAWLWSGPVLGRGPYSALEGRPTSVVEAGRFGPQPPPHLHVLSLPTRPPPLPCLLCSRQVAELTAGVEARASDVEREQAAEAEAMARTKGLRCDARVRERGACPRKGMAPGGEHVGKG